MGWIVGAPPVSPRPRLVISRAPLRIGFVGGGSDLSCYATGSTIAATINQYVYCVAKWRNDSKVYLSWRQKEIADDAWGISHDIVRTCLVRLGILRGVEILTFADVPGVGSGLGSSAATTLAVLKALLALRGLDVSQEWLAEKACEIELEWLRRKGGRQDQWISALGGLWRFNWRKGQLSRRICLAAPQSKLDLLREHFLLFSPKNGEGRNADEILSTARQRPEFAIDCRKLADAWQIRYEEGISWESFGEAIWTHGMWKSEEFPKHFDKETRQQFDGIRRCWKLCGAGQTGHLLVGTTMANRADDKKAWEAVWGPELPFEFTTAGTSVIHSE